MFHRVNKAKLIIGLLFLLFVMFSSMSVFGSRPQETTPSPEPSESVADIPTTTSEELDVYADGLSIVHSDGSKAEGYSYDSDGNICDVEGKFAVALENVVPFTYVTKVRYNSADTKKALPAYVTEERTVGTTPASFEFELRLEPEDAVNRTIVIESEDPGTLYIPYEANKGLMSGSERPEANAMPSITIRNAKSPLKIVLIGSVEGTAPVTIRNVKDEEIGKITFSFEAEEIEIPPEEELTAKKEQEHVHTYIDTVVAPTYSSGGYTLHVCSKCGDSYRDNYTAKLVCEHDYATKVIEPTLTTEGYTLYTCRRCGATKRDNYTQVKTCSHSWDSGTVTTGATCSREGVKTYRCTLCGVTKTEQIPRTDHNYSAGQVVQPTKTSDGYTLYTCRYCGETKKDNITKYVPCSHSWDAGNVTTSATCIAEGVKTYRCTICGETKTETIPRTDHNYTVTRVVQPTKISNGYTLYTCSHCGVTKKDNYTQYVECSHSWDAGSVTSAAACTSDGIRTYHCTLCGETRTESIPKTGHSWDAGSVTMAATCSHEGVKTFRCTLCGETRTENIPKTAHTMVSSVVPPTESSEGYTRHYCSVCGYETEHTDIVAKLGHQHNYTSTSVAPTCTEPGYILYLCSCGDSYRGEETSPALGHDWQMIWEPDGEPVTVMHEYCSDCYLDFTSAGMSGGDIEAHSQTHIAEGGSGQRYTAPVIHNPGQHSVWVCSRCGAR